MQERRLYAHDRRLYRDHSWAGLLCLLCLLALPLLSGCDQSVLAFGRSPTAQQARLTYVALGASDTFGTGASDPYTQNWPSDLALLLKQKAHLINLGIPGITLHNALTSEMPIALDAHPDLVTIWLAVNDLAQMVPVTSYRHDLEALLTRLHAAAPQAHILVGNVPDLTKLPAFANVDPSQLQQEILAYNLNIREATARHHALLVDLYGASYDLQLHPEYISSDGLHPSDLGYIKLANLFAGVIAKAWPGEAV